MNRRSRTLVVGLVIALVGTLVGASSVIAASKRHKVGVAAKATDEQTIVWRTGKRNRAYTTSTKWQVLPMPSGGCAVGSDVCESSSFPSPLISAKGPISLTFSGMFSQGPVEIRFRDGAHLMRPGAVNFRPEPMGNAFSFTFVSPRKGERPCEGPQLEWRSPTGQETRLNKATVVVHYKKFEPEQQVGCV
jgi:hypothetical protein